MGVDSSSYLGPLITHRVIRGNSEEMDCFGAYEFCSDGVKTQLDSHQSAVLAEIPVWTGIQLGGIKGIFTQVQMTI